MAKEKTVNEEVKVEAEQPVTPQAVEVAPEVAPKEEPKKEAAKPKAKTKGKSVEDKTLDRLVMETKRGDHGTGRERMLSLGSRYADVQKEIVIRERKASK